MNSMRQTDDDDDDHLWFFGFCFGQIHFETRTVIVITIMNENNR